MRRPLDLLGFAFLAAALTAAQDSQPNASWEVMRKTRRGRRRKGEPRRVSARREPLPQDRSRRRRFPDGARFRGRPAAAGAPGRPARAQARRAEAPGDGRPDAPDAALEPTAEGTKFFESKIRPVLVDELLLVPLGRARANLKADLRLDTRDRRAPGRRDRPGDRPGRPERQPARSRRSATRAPRCRRRASSSADVIRDFETWVKMGAARSAHRRGEGGATTEERPRRVEAHHRHRRGAEVLVVPAGREDRSRRPASPTRGPSTTSTASCSRGMESHGLSPSKDAQRATWLRRVTFDLTGLPPTPEEIAAFVKDHGARRVREGRRPPARLAALRRALGAALARRRALRRIERQGVQRPLPARLALPRLGHRGVQRGQAVRPVPPRAARRRPAAVDEPDGEGRAPDRDRVPRPRPEGPPHAQPAAVHDGPRRRADRRDVPRRCSASPSPAPAATTTSSTRSRPRTTTRSPGIFRSTKTEYGTIRFQGNQHPVRPDRPAAARPRSRAARRSRASQRTLIERQRERLKTVSDGRAARGRTAATTRQARVRHALRDAAARRASTRCSRASTSRASRSRRTARPWASPSSGGRRTRACSCAARSTGRATRCRAASSRCSPTRRLRRSRRGAAGSSSPRGSRRPTTR